MRGCLAPGEAQRSVGNLPAEEEGEAVRFIQIIESEGDVAEELAGVQGYAEQAAGDETVKVERVTICGDRARPGPAPSRCKKGTLSIRAGRAHGSRWPPTANG